MSHSLPSVDAAINSIDTISGYDASTGASSLSNNTWGFRKNTGTSEEPVYTNWYAVGAKDSTGTVIDSPGEGTGSYCDSLSYPLNQSGCNPSSYRTYNINVGAKLTSSLPAGTYTNDIVFSATTKSEGTKYTMNFNSNGGNAGNVINPRIVIAGLSTILPTSGFTKDGMGIKGWAFTDGATTPVYTAGQTVATNDLILAARAAGQDTETNNSFTVYAVWELATMQNFSCSSLASGASTTLVDARGTQKKYTVKKLADDNCWMMENLSISNVVMTDQDTNLAPNATFDLTTGITQSGDSGWCTTNSDACDNIKAVYAREDANGYLYNWYTATAGNGTYSGATVDGTNIDYDICPKGWHLPVGRNNKTTNQFALLDIAINPGDSFAGTDRNKNASGVNLDTQTASFNNMTNIFPLAGFIYLGSLDYVGTGGYYWSSTAQSNNRAYNLSLHSSNLRVDPRNSYLKYSGHSVRCVTD